MEYTIKQAAEITGLSAHTLRYYDREGLIPLLNRTPSGIRKYTDTDINWLQLICCLKRSGMSIEKIKEFMLLCLKGKTTCEARHQLLTEHRELILKQLKELKESLEIVDFKLAHYQEVGIFHIDHLGDNE